MIERAAPTRQVPADDWLTANAAWQVARAAMQRSTLAIGHIAITGVDPGTAQALPAAIKAALNDLPSLSTGDIPHLRLHLPAGATAADIAVALATALKAQS